ncbi:MAG TPA: hypothetical protein VM537_24075 [Anaerolineae bacterium]|nr:hypothetical protein [Anaerolineae bacterium]
MNVYICFCCGYPIIFRRWRGNPHQILHIPTGWPCWRLWEEGLCLPGLPGSLAFPRTTPLKERKRLAKQANKHYREYLRSGNVKSLVRFVSRQVEARRGDVVGDLLASLSEEEDVDTRPLVRSIVGSSAWKEYSRELRRERLYSDYRQTREATSILQYLQALLARGNVEEALEMAEFAFDLVEDVESKVICWYQGICAREFKGDSEGADRETARLIDYLGPLEKRVRVPKRGLGLLRSAIRKRLEGERRDRLQELLSFLTGAARLEELEGARMSTLG